MSAVVAVMLTGGTAFATSTTFTETINNINFGIEGATYDGMFTDANLKSGSTVFNNSQYTITSATVDLTVVNGQGHSIKLTIDGIAMDLPDTASPQTLQYNLSSTLGNYIQSQDGTFNYFVTVDCTLESAELIVDTTSGSNSHVPDGASTAALLGGAMTLLGWVKRHAVKLA